MAPTKTLPIYRTAMKLVQHLHQCTRKAPRDLRFTLIQRLLDECVEICVDAVDANRHSGSELPVITTATDYAAAGPASPNPAA